MPEGSVSVTDASESSTDWKPGASEMEIGIPEKYHPMMKSLIEQEVKWAEAAARKSQKELDLKLLQKLEKEHKEATEKQMQWIELKNTSLIRRLKDQHETMILAIKQDCKDAIQEIETSTHHRLEKDLAEVKTRLTHDYRQKLEETEAKCQCQRDQAIRRMAEQCDLQLKGLRDWSQRERQAAIKALNTKWCQFINEQEAHLEREQLAQVEAVRSEFQRSLDRLNVDKERKQEKAGELESKLQRAYGVLQEVASGRSMIGGSRNLNQLLQRMDDATADADAIDDAAPRPRPSRTTQGGGSIPRSLNDDDGNASIIAYSAPKNTILPAPDNAAPRSAHSHSLSYSSSQHSSSSSSESLVAHMADLRVAAAVQHSSRGGAVQTHRRAPLALDESSLQLLGYSNPGALLQTVTAVGRGNLALTKTLFKTARPQYLPQPQLLNPPTLSPSSSRARPQDSFWGAGVLDGLKPGAHFDP